MLGGRVRYQQPKSGYRSGIEPILLAASVCARPGQRVIEAGTGAGAGLLCLLSREPGVLALGVEKNPHLAEVARGNLALNGFTGGRVETGDIILPRQDGLFDHAFSNPPWHAAESTASGDEMRDGAKRATSASLEEWIGALGKLVRPGGTLTLLIPAAVTGRSLTALVQSKCGSTALCPLWPHAGQEARLVLVQGRKLGRAGTRVLPGLVLHEGQGFSPAARHILWEGGRLALA